MSERIRVMLVDDDLNLRTAWDRLIRSQQDMELVATLDRADELVSTAVREQPHVVLLDLTMTGSGPLEAVTQLAARAPQVRVVVYSGHCDRTTVQRVMDAGTWGFADKLESPSEVLQTLRTVAGGGMVFPRMNHSRPVE